MNNNVRYYKITATIITGMGPEESGIPENYWLPPDGHSLGPLSHLPPTSGKGKVVVVAIAGMYTALIESYLSYVHNFSLHYLRRILVCTHLQSLQTAKTMM